MSQSVLATPVGELRLTPALVNAALDACGGVERHIMHERYRITRVRSMPSKQRRTHPGTPWQIWPEFDNPAIVPDWAPESQRGIAQLLVDAGVYELP